MRYLLFVLLLLSNLLYAQIQIKKNTNDHWTVSLVEAEVSGIRLLQVTDLHLGKNGFWKEDLASFRRIERLVEIHNPHLIAITGDLFTGEKLFGSMLAAAAVQFFDSLERPWLYVFGNHDPEGGFGRDQIKEVFDESEWGILGFHKVDGDLKIKYDFVVNVQAENIKKSWLIYAFDSGSRKGFKSIKPNQIDWYRETSHDINPKLDARAISIFHIPLKQYQDLWDDSTIKKYGESKEKVFFEEDDGSVYDAFVKRGEIEATFCGHDHYNSYWGTYHGGITLAYGYISGEATKWAWPTGGKLITLPLDSSDIRIENVVPVFDK
jgi:3',5'-cyclic AMP phosphodiesterase CpdA